MDLSIIIVTYNSARDIVRCLESVGRTAAPGTTVVVVDNHSADPTVELVRERFPGVKLIVHTGNLGFAGGNNSALPETSGRYLLLLNPDTVVHDGAISEMVRYLEAHPECAICGPVLEDGEGRLAPQLPAPTVGNVVLTCCGMSRLVSQRTERRAPAALSGACMLVRSSLIEEIGFLDEGMHTHEDVDFCWRARQRGHQLALVDGARVTHFVGRSGNIGYVVRRSYESAFRFHRKHTAGAGRGIAYLALTLQLLLRYLKWRLHPRPSSEAAARRGALAGLIRRLPELWRGEPGDGMAAATRMKLCP